MEQRNITSEIQATQKFAFIEREERKASPEYIESNNRNGWIDWGIDNQYPDYLLSLLNKSPIHNSIVNMKASMISGNGFVDASWDDQMILFIKNIWSSDDLEEITSKIGWDLTIFGGYYLKITWNELRTRIAAIEHIPVRNVRIAKKEYRDIYGTDSYWVCDGWSDRNKKPTLYPGYSTKDRSKAVQILMVKEPRPQNNYYPIPDYFAGINVIETDFQINEFHLSNIKDGFAPNMHINFCYNPATDDELEDAVERLNAQYKGVAKNKTVITFEEDPARKPTFDPIETSSADTKYIELSKHQIDAIVYTHQLSSKKLIAIEVSGDAHKNELLEALSVFQAIYIAPKQNFIEKELARLTRVNGLSDKIKLKTFDTNLTPDLSVSDVMAILESDKLTDKQKIQMFVDKGYARTRAELLVTKGGEVTTEKIM